MKVINVIHNWDEYFRQLYYEEQGMIEITRMKKYHHIHEQCEIENIKHSIEKEYERQLMEEQTK